MIKIVVADDHELVRNGIRRLLEDNQDFDVVAEVSSGEQAVQFCRKTPPNVVLMDVNMPGIGGLEATTKITRLSEDIFVLCLSMYTEHPIPAQVMQAGAHGFITKDADRNSMVNAIYKVAAGQKYLPPEIAQSIALNKFGTGNENPFDSLSTRELNIALRIAKGDRVPDIAVGLSINAKTVNTYRYRMFEKLGVNSDVELTHLVLRHKLLDPNTL